MYQKHCNKECSTGVHPTHASVENSSGPTVGTQSKAVGLPTESIGPSTELTHVRQAYTRDTHASRAKSVAGSAAQGRGPWSAQLRTAARDNLGRDNLARMGPPERSASRATTDRMLSGKATNSCQASHLALPYQTSPSAPCGTAPPPTPVLPPDRHTSAEAFLAKNGWRVDQGVLILICLQCEGIINPAKVRDHIMRFHREVHPGLQLQAQFEAACGSQFSNLTFEPAHPCTPVPFISGLKFQPNIQICSVCKRGFGQDQDRDPRQMSRSFKKHVCKKGDKTIP